MRLLNEEIRCRGVTVRTGDLVVANEEDVVVVPAARQDELLQAARAKEA
ncbi:RraA family protein [Streptomyces albidoflavus]